VVGIRRRVGVLASWFKGHKGGMARMRRMGRMDMPVGRLPGLGGARSFKKGQGFAKKRGAGALFMYEIYCGECDAILN